MYSSFASALFFKKPEPGKPFQSPSPGTPICGNNWRHYDYSRESGRL